GGRAQSARDPPKSLERVRPLSRFWGSRTKRHFDLGGRAQSARDPPKSLERVRLPQKPYFYPMQTLQLECNTLDELPRCARELLKFAGDQRIMLFYGEMGAGKTTLIRSICQELRVTGPVSSPTFALVNEYDSPAGPVFHFDCYRLKNEQEAYDIGMEEYFDSGCYCLVEWPEKIEGLLPEQHIKIVLTSDKNLRKIKLRNFT
ncbi:MAG: tRNA (adenosine(37)-N6)-threonylcarbamoyltransferase complex ATPase subunit type 1 TsaE, partial [Solitalea sp.]